MQGFDSANSSFGARLYNPFGMQVVDTPNTTSATTYKICILGYQGTGYHIGTNTWDVNSLTVSEIAA